MNKELKDPALWRRLQEFNLDDPSAQFSLSDRLSRENGWSLDYSKRVIDEYKKFLYLSVSEKTRLTPSDEVDQAWHLHMIYTESYWKELCGKVLTVEFHHGPTKGGKSEGEKYWGMYEKTLSIYRDVFDEPPLDIWPKAEDRFSNVVFRRVNMHENVVVNKKRVKEHLLPYAAGILLGIIASVSIYASEVDQKDLIIFFLALIVALFMIRGVWRYVNRRKRASLEEIQRYRDSRSSNSVSSKSSSSVSSNSSNSSSSSSRSSSDSGCTVIGSFFGCSSSGDSGCSSSGSSGCSSSGCSGCGGGGCGGCGS
jgi:hypothetical protein